MKLVIFSSFLELKSNIFSPEIFALYLYTYVLRRVNFQILRFAQHVISLSCGQKLTVECVLENYFIDFKFILDFKNFKIS